MNTKKWLFFTAVAILMVTAYTLTDNSKKHSENISQPQNTKKYIVAKNSNFFEISTESPNDTYLASAEKSEQNDKTQADTKPAEISKLKDRCLSILSTADKNINSSYISLNEQRKMTGIFDDCIYEIDMELALIERQFKRSPENMTCLNSAYEIRDYLLELGTNAQQFSYMPNNTDSDKVLLAEIYSQVLNDIIKNGNSAMEIRKTVCVTYN